MINPQPSIFTPRPYQQAALDFIMQRPASALFLDMGMGKTAITLTAIDRWIFDDLSARRVLVVAPLRVAKYTWPEEVAKWQHTQHLRLNVCTGSTKERQRAISTPSDIVVINRENLSWLIDTYSNAWPFDALVVDELTSFKNPGSQRFRRLRKMIGRFNRVVGLTGTPAGRGLLGLWPQIYILDQGARLGRTYGDYLRRYFNPGARCGYVVYAYAPKACAEAEIYRAIGDCCLSLKSSDYLRDLPTFTEIDRPVVLGDEVVKGYRRFEREQVLALDTSESITAATAAALTNKLLQYGNGAVYDESGAWQHVHDAKLDALADLLEEAGGEPVLCFYSYRSDAERIAARFAGLNPRTLDTVEDKAEWDAGRVPLLLAHPASMGHGLNLQRGGHLIVWFGLTWDWELYAQANKRLHRPGQSAPVLCYRLIATGTRDEAVAAALGSKEGCNAALLDGVKATLAR